MKTGFYVVHPLRIELRSQASEARIPRRSPDARVRTCEGAGYGPHRSTQAASPRLTAPGRGAADSKYGG